MLNVMDMKLKNIHLLEKFELNSEITTDKPFEITEIFNGERRRILKISLTDGEILKKHKADEPITIFCLAGKGVFKAGASLEEEIEIEAGTLLTLAPKIMHEIIGTPAVSILLTKFK